MNILVPLDFSDCSMREARDGIVHVAKEVGADLIVVGSHGRRGVKRLVLGSVAEDIVRRAPCPVLVVRMKESS